MGLKTRAGEVTTNFQIVMFLRLAGGRGRAEKTRLPAPESGKT
jgi:hypothetical protein